MRLRCHLREVRGSRTLAEVARLSGVPEAELSKIERGIELPRDEWIAPLEQAYGRPLDAWYPPLVRQAFDGGQGTGPVPQALFRPEELVGIKEASRTLSRLVTRLSAGELDKGIIVRRGRPVAVLLGLGRYADLTGRPDA